MRVLGKTSRSQVSGLYRPVAFLAVAVLIISASFQLLFGNPKPAQAFTVPGQSYEICNEAATYLTSPWTYNATSLPAGLGSPGTGSEAYSVAQYEAIPGYGTTLPSLPSYIANESSGTEAAVIFTPGAQTSLAPYDFPETPIMYFFEGGSYGVVGLATISGDEFIGGSASGFGEPQFNDGGGANGIDAGNGSYYFSGGFSTLAATANSGTNTITTAAAIPGYINWVTFADGSTYQISNNGGTTLTLGSNLSATESAGTTVWANQTQPLAEVTTAAAQGATSLTLTASTVPFMQYASVIINGEAYTINSVSGSQSGYTLDFTGGVDTAVAANTPIYYNASAGAVTVEYLDIADDQHNTTGTIYTGSGWTVEHNNIHDGYSGGPGFGVAIYGGDESTIEYNCLSKMGDYGVNIFGTNDQFDYNEIYDTNYQPDPGCGCSGGGKWWGTLNADIVDNAFLDDGPGGGGPIWLDNGNSGTNIAGNYFYMSDGSSVESETGFNLNVTDNLFQDSGWGSGTGCGGTNCDGAVNINSSGGFNVPGSRYENQISITNNQFINDWMGIDEWEAGGRNCENSGEGWPSDAPYCSGGFPNTANTTAGGQYYFSHISDSTRGGTQSLVQAASVGATTLLVDGSEAINDQIGFADALSTTTSSTSTDVTTLSGSGTVNVTSTTGWPSSGQLRVGTSAAWSDGNGSWTGAILSYTGTTSTSFTGVSLVRGTGTLSGPVLEVQPYQVTSETCYANDCAVNISPALATSQPAGQEIAGSGTCQLFATASATAAGPLAPSGVSYWDGCQWQTKDIAVSGNTFVFQPSLITATPNITGAANNTCDPANNGCGTNFMADQFNSGEAPFNDQTGANAMISNSSFTGCPGWDPGCSSDPLTNVNAMASPPGAPASNGEAPDNNLWSGNTYDGPWTFNAYIFGNCSGGGVYMPTDGSNSLSPSACNVDVTGWQQNYQQDAGSTYNPMIVSLSGLTANQEIQSSAQSVKAFEDTESPATISSTVSLNSSTAQTLTSSPFDFSVNTLNYSDGPYTLKVTGTDSNSNTSSDSVSVYVSNGDLNGDGVINLSDLAVMASHYGAADSNYSDGNITGQSTINLSDLAILAANWGWSHP